MDPIVNKDDVTADDLSVNNWQQSGRGFGNTKNALFANNHLMALSAAAVLALAGASASSVANYSQTNYTSTTTSASSACRSVEIATTSDPDINTRFDGQLLENNHYDKSLANFSTFYNTQGGNTTLSTVVAKIQPTASPTWYNPVYGGEYEADDVFNTSTTLTHGGANGWSMTVTISNGSPSATIRDAGGRVIANSIPSGGLTLSDGTTVSVQGGTILVDQPLNQGGIVESGFSVGTAYWNNGTQTSYLSAGQTATGAAILNGDATSLSVGADTPILALPCNAVTNYNATRGNEQTEITNNFITDNENNGSAYDPHADAATESM